MWMVIALATRLSSFQGFVFPNNVAFPFGGQGSPEYLVMELHYDNPDRKRGISCLHSVVSCASVRLSAKFCLSQVLWIALV